MSRLKPHKLHVQFLNGIGKSGLQLPRRYTLTHSDLTGDLFLSIGLDYDRQATSGWYIRLMRDEVLAEWVKTESGHALHVYCHVSGGLTFGPAIMRYSIFQHELPLALEALRYGDAGLYDTHPELDQAPIWVHFRSTRRRYQHDERWGTPGEYRIR